MPPKRTPQNLRRKKKLKAAGFCNLAGTLASGEVCCDKPSNSMPEVIVPTVAMAGVRTLQLAALHAVQPVHDVWWGNDGEVNAITV
jgi:hypothetical protein